VFIFVRADFVCPTRDAKVNMCPECTYILGPALLIHGIVCGIISSGRVFCPSNSMHSCHGRVK
jgi:hypothetical protein